MSSPRPAGGSSRTVRLDEPETRPGPVRPGHDAAAALGLELPLPGRTCARTMARVFPWVPSTDADPGLLLLAVTGRARVVGVPADPQWWWQSAPIAEWDGRPRRRTSPAGWC